MAGKGSARRSGDNPQAYEEGWDRIFSKNKDTKKQESTLCRKKKKKTKE